ncbi:hypothetical protein FVEN_g13108 [Fusarium venenatum]|nr:hypothetical protein FVEN_g13108 [Fusarium venenatum]
MDMAMRSSHDPTEAADLFTVPVQDAPLGSEEVAHPGDDLERVNQRLL